MIPRTSFTSNSDSAHETEWSLLRTSKWREPIFALLFLILAVFVIGILSLAFRPVRVDYGAVWGPYLAEPEDSLDYLYLGSSYAYCDVDPVTVYDRTGLTGYVLAGPEQTLSQTYWYLKEALNTQTPSLVLLEGSALAFQKYQSYTQVNVGYMPFGLNQLGAIFTASEPELRTGLLFPLYFYHGRWKDLTAAEAAAALLPSETDTLKGFTPVSGVFEQIADGPFTREAQPEEVYEENLSWLSRIAALCRKHGITLALVFHPTYSQLPTDTRQRIADDAAALDILFYDWTEGSTSIGITPTLHYYDPGHLNQEGAAIFSSWLGDFLTDELALTPRTQEAVNTAAWERVVLARNGT